jgi:hypothetical protein
VFWTVGTGTGGQPPVGLDELELVGIDPLPSWVCCQDMADFAESITDERAGHRLARAIQGRGAFRRFRDELHDEYPDLLPAWCAFRDARPKRHPMAGQQFAHRRCFCQSLLGRLSMSRAALIQGYPG